MKESLLAPKAEQKLLDRAERRRDKAIMKLWEAHGLIDDALLRERVAYILRVLASMPRSGDDSKRHSDQDGEEKRAA